MNWDMVLCGISWVLILSGSAFTVIGAIGTLRFPDFWSRLHAASVSESAGMILLIAGMCLHSYAGLDAEADAGFNLIMVKLVIIAVFIFITGPTSTHAVASAALTSGEKPECEDQTTKTEKDAT